MSAQYLDQLPYLLPVLSKNRLRLSVRSRFWLELGNPLGDSWALGMAAHWANGVVIFPLLYAMPAYRILPGGPVTRGANWGIALWLIAQTILMPMIGAGVSISAAGGFMAVMASLIRHVLYGGILGISLGPLTQLIVRLS